MAGGIVGGIRAGLKTLCEGMATPLRTYDTVPASPETPCAVIEPDEPFIEYLGAMQNGLTTYSFRVLLLTGQASLRDAQVKLDTLLSGAGADSLNVALRADQTLSGSCSSSKIARADTYGAHDFNNVTLIGAVVHVVAVVSN